MKKMSIIIHGGCSNYDLDEIEIAHQEEQRKGLEVAIALGWKMLQKGEKALEVVEKVVNSMEECPAFNAGIGAVIGIEGQVDLDASIMDGATMQCGAVATIKGIPYAISIARKVMEDTRHVFLVGEGVNLFARKYGYKILPDKAFYTKYQEYRLKEFMRTQKLHTKGTVGAVVMDMYGNIAAGTSTGGMRGKLPGRVGDSPLIGAGTYAVNAYGGASATGNGEQLIQVGLTRTVIDLINYKKLNAKKATKAAIKILEKVPDGFGGAIAIDSNGEIGFAANDPIMPRAYMTSTQKTPKVEFSLK